METPSSTSRSQDSLSSQKKNMQEETNPSNAKSDRTALIDITNDSPIVGLALGSLKTPSSTVAKSRGRPIRTPGSGEALLRGQVKTLLQKVEEESELVKLPLPEEPQSAAPFRTLLSHLLSPRALLAPTPANTPQILEHVDLSLPQSAPVSSAPQEKEHLGECQLNRALHFDSPEKSEVSESSTICSALTYEGSSCGFGEKGTDEECSSAWSIRANASSGDNKEEQVEGDDCYEEEDLEEGDDCGSLLDELCQGIRDMSVVEKREVPEFAGKHTRFVYNSDDEIEGAEEVGKNGVAVSPSVIVLRGLPVPEGKHLRFQEDEEEED